MTKQSLVICHNSVGSIQAKNSEQAIALAQCLGELEEEIKKVDRGANVVVMEKKEPGPGSPEARRVRAANRKKAAGPQATPSAKDSTSEK